MCARSFVVLFCILNVLVYVAEGNEVIRSTYCYGDSSHGNNLVNINCGFGVIRVLDVITATKPSSLGCPADDHDYTPAQQQLCCTYNASDCMARYTGDTGSYYNCSGRARCLGVPIVRQPSGCDSVTHPRFTNYLILEYSCVQDGLLNGACLVDSDCTVNNTVCTNRICVCRTGFGELDKACIEDGIPNGACIRGESPCQDVHSYCSSTNNRCTCRSGYTEDRGTCIKITSQVRQPVYCFGDSSHNSNLIDITCTVGVIYVMDILTGSKPSIYNCPENDHTYTPAQLDTCCSHNDSDCIASFTGEAGAYYACAGKKHCAGIPIVKQRNNCPAPPQYPDFSNFLIFKYVCVPEGHIHGACDSSDACVDRNSECFEQLCRCVDGFSDRDHACWEDGTAGVDCLPDQTCLDPNAFCSSTNNTCVCNPGFSFVDGVCAEPCSSNSDCSRPLTICSEGGVCECVAGYEFVHGVCEQDGCIGCSCQHDSDCRDALSSCGSDLKCRCSSGYSYKDGSCILDGSLDAACLPDNTCTDAYAVCVDGKCQCNAVRNYTNQGGICLRDDQYINGACRTTYPCHDVNAYCSWDTRRCVCNNYYVEINGVCQLGTTPAVTACNGTSPYNTLEPDCDRDSVSVKTRTYRRSKRISSSCQQNLNVYDHAYYLSCCTPDPDDCEENEIGTGNCLSVYYEVVEYTCLHKDQVIDVGADGEVEGTDVVITNPDTDTVTDVTDTTPVSVYNCSIQASCTTDIDVVVLRNTLEKVNGLCSCNVSIVGDGSETAVTCDGPAADHYTSIRTVTNGFVQVQIEYRGSIRRGFAILFRAVNRNAILTATCGLGAKQTGISNLGTCPGIGLDDNVIEVNQDNDTTGNEVGLVPPGYNNGTAPDWTSEPTVYYCSIQASCITAIDVYVLVNTLEKDNNVCSCNISIIGDGGSTEVTCDKPRPSWFSRVFSVTSGFVRAVIRYNGGIKGQFLILFRAVNTNAYLTASCGKRSMVTPIGGLPPCRVSGTGPPCIGVDDDDDSNGDHVAEITDPIGSSPTGSGVYYCSIQSSCVTTINVHVVRNTLQKDNGVCSCNISVLDQGQGRSTDVTCDGPAANLRKAIMSVTGGFVRVEIRYHGDIEGSFIIRFTAVNKNTRLTASCGTGAKRIGLPNLETCGADDTSIAVDEDDVVSGPGCSLTNPGYPGEDDSSPSNGLSMYHCSVQASCVTNINAFVMLNTLQERNGICSCNITLNGNGTTSNVTCDGPAGNYFTPVFSVVNGFIRTDIYYHGTIYGRFFILFRAVDKYAKLTAACGSRARQIGATDLDTCAAFGTGDGSLEVHKNDTRNGSDVSVTNPGYGGGTVPGTSGLSLYQCSVQASCNTQIKAYVLVNTLQKTNNMCFCNITLTADSSTTDVTCDGPAQNRNAPIVSISSGFVKVDVAYRASTSGDFVLEFRAVNRNAVLTVGCGTQAAQSGISNLGACRRYGDGDTTIPIDEDGSSRDTEVTITEPSALPSTGTGRYTCSVHAYCNTTIEAFLLTNRIQKVNGVCSGTITLHGSDATSVVTCDGLGSNRFVPIFTEPRGFVRVQFDYTRTNTGQFKLAFRGRDPAAIVTVSCRSYALEQSDCQVSANANTEGGGGGNSNLIIIIVVVVVVVVLLVLAVILWICRQRIRSKLCPQKSKPSIEPIEGVTIIEKPILAPTPGNTKFPGRSPNDMTTPKGKLGRMPSSSSMVDYLYKEKMDSEKNTMATTLPAFTRDKDAVVNTKFKRRQTLQELVQTQGQKFDEAEQKKQKKKSKKMKKLKRKMTNARNVITASRAFELQKSYDASESVGTYRPLGEGLMHNGTVHPEGLYPGATMDQPPLPFTPYVHGHSFMGSMPGPGIPNFAVSGAEADHPVPGPAHLPPLVMANQPRPAHLPPLPFSSGTAWKKAGAASGVAGRMVVKKKRTLDISSIDDPGSVEHAELY